MNLKLRNPVALATAGMGSAPDSTMAHALQPQLKQLAMRLSSAWKWVDQSYTQQRLSKRLKIAETVSLGEKRFVSILQVDGAQFLIGGTANSISLLATMEESAETSHNFAEVLRRQSQPTCSGTEQE